MSRLDDKPWMNEAIQNMMFVFLGVVAIIAGLFMFGAHLDNIEQKEEAKEIPNWAKDYDRRIPAENVRYYNPETGEIRYLEQGPAPATNPEFEEIYSKHPYGIPPEDYLDQMDELDMLEYYEFYRGD